MKKFGFASIIANGLAAAVLGLAAPAQADLGHNHLGAGHPTAGQCRLSNLDLRQRSLTRNFDQKGRPHKGAPSSHVRQSTAWTAFPTPMNRSGFDAGFMVEASPAGTPGFERNRWSRIRRAECS